MAHVLIVSLGPVQDFIAAARRCRDLWFGSWLLSELTKAAALALAEECGLEALVFPGTGDLSFLKPGTETTVANKIVLRTPDGMEPRRLAEEVGRAAVGQRLRAIREEAFGHIQDLPAGYFERQAADAQVDDLIEYTWAAAREEDEGSFAGARAAAEALLSARRNTLLWGQPSWGKAGVPKSSIDGQRESVLREALYDLAGALGADELFRRYGIGPSERLCGVGLLKRHGRREGSRYGHRFLSTGHLAAWPLLQRLEGLPPGSQIRAAWQHYLRTLGELGVVLEDVKIPRDREHPVVGFFDGSLLYESRLAELFEAVADPAERRRRVAVARTALAEVLRRAAVTTPLAYYAILLADGDRMGDLKNRQQTPGDQRQLSRRLSGFAENARAIVEGRHGGELIYAGGDDVLAFVPLHRAIACARDLARDFGEKLSAYQADDGRPPSLSAGIGISHFLEPLAHSLELAREAEGLAKDQPGRNALAVIVDKRSGPPTAVAGPWGEIDAELDAELDDYVRLHVEDLVPDGAAYELRELARLLAGAEGPERAALAELARKEAVRILRRKQPAHGAKAQIAAPILDRLEVRLAVQEPGVLAGRLIVARLLAEAELQSRVPEEVP